MTRKLIALAFIAAFGLAQAADGPPAAFRMAADTRTGNDAALGNVPETTQPVGTAANKKKTHKKSERKHRKAPADSSAPPRSDSGNPANPVDR